MKKVYVTPVVEFDVIEDVSLLNGSVDPDYMVDTDDPDIPDLPIGPEEDDDEYDYSI